MNISENQTILNIYFYIDGYRTDSSITELLSKIFLKFTEKKIEFRKTDSAENADLIIAIIFDPVDISIEKVYFKNCPTWVFAKETDENQKIKTDIVKNTDIHIRFYMYTEDLLEKLAILIDSINQFIKPKTNETSIFLGGDINLYGNYFDPLKNSLSEYNFFMYLNSLEYGKPYTNDLQQLINKSAACILLTDPERIYEKDSIYLDFIFKAQKPVIIVLIKGYKNQLKQKIENAEIIEFFDLKKIKKTLSKILSDKIAIQMLSDFAIESLSEDRLGFDSYSSAIKGIIDSPKTGTPFTLVINAPWGAGKSSIGKLIEQKLKTSPSSSGHWSHITCWFNAWMHDDAENLNASFMSFIVNEANKRRKWWVKFIHPISSKICPPGERLKSKLRSYGFIISLSIIVSIILYLIFHHLISDESRNCIKDTITAIFKKFGISLNFSFNILTKKLSFGGFLTLLFTSFMAIRKKVIPIAKNLVSFLNNPKEEAKSGQLEKVRNELHKLIRQATPKGSRFVIFIDDLERCYPPSPINILETINQMLNIPEVVVVIMADIQMIAASAEIKYEKLSEKITVGSFGQKYIQKFIQLQFDIPFLNKGKIEDLMENNIQKIIQNKSISKETSDETLKKKNTLLTLNQIIYSVIGLSYHSPKYILSNFNTSLSKFIGVIMSITLFPQRAIIKLFDSYGFYSNWKLPPSHQSYLSKTGKALLLFQYMLLFWSPLEIYGISLYYLISNITDLILLVIPIILLFHGILFNLYKGLKFKRFIQYIDNKREPESTVDANTDESMKDVELVKSIEEEIMQRDLTDDSKLFKLTREEALILLNNLHLLLPRNAKRIINKIRLHLYIANQKNLELLKHPNIHKYVARWVILQEKWPEIIYFISKHDPVKELESIENLACGNDNNFENYMKENLKVYLFETEKIKTFFQSKPALSEKLNFLLYFGE